MYNSTFPTFLKNSTFPTFLKNTTFLKNSTFRKFLKNSTFPTVTMMMIILVFRLVEMVRLVEILTKNLTGSLFTGIIHLIEQN